MITQNLCKCNNCENILIDENPQIKASEFPLKGNELNMIWCESENAWVCPKCLTDGYLTDIEEEPKNESDTNIQAFVGFIVFKKMQTN